MYLCLPVTNELWYGAFQKKWVKSMLNAACHIPKKFFAFPWLVFLEKIKKTNSAIKH